MRISKVKLNTVSFGEAAQLFLQAKAAQGLRERTLKDYQKELTRFDNALHPDFKNLTTDVLAYAELWICAISKAYRKVIYYSV